MQLGKSIDHDYSQIIPYVHPIWVTQIDYGIMYNNSEPPITQCVDLYVLTLTPGVLNQNMNLYVKLDFRLDISLHLGFILQVHNYMEAEL